MTVMMTEETPRICSDPINVVIPMAGLGTRFANAGYREPKPFIRIDSVPMIDAVLANITYGFDTNALRVYLVINPDHFQMLKMTGILDVPCVSVIISASISMGALWNVLRAESFINSCVPLMIANSDQWMEFEPVKWYTEMMRSGYFGSIALFKSNEQKWSYAVLDAENKNILSVAEKQVVSEWATCGAYLFRRGSDFVNSAWRMIDQEKKVNGEYYVCPVYNELIGHYGKGVQPYFVDEMWGMGTPDDLDKSINEKFMRLEEPLHQFSRRALS